MFLRRIKWGDISSATIKTPSPTRFKLMRPFQSGDCRAPLFLRLLPYPGMRLRIGKVLLRILHEANSPLTNGGEIRRKRETNNMVPF